MRNGNGSFIYLEKVGAIAIVTINNPPLNILTDEVLTELDLALDEIVNFRDCRGIIVKALGEKAFAAGADIQQFPSLSKSSGIELVEKGKKIFDRLSGSEMPVICAINGLALGAELALACDIRIAEENARLGLPETGLGILPGYGGTQRLARLIGPGKAKEIIFTGETLSAKEAYEIGLVERVVPVGESFAHAKILAGKIAEKGPLAISNAKKAVDYGLDMHLCSAQALETELFSNLCETRDMKEGIQAFMEKRKPVFIGE